MGIMKYSRLGDTFFEDKAKKINQALEKINAPYYQVCKKVRGSKANKDAFDISWRKRNITCDTDYPNATTTGEKVVMRQLEKHFGISLSLLNSDTPRAIKKSLDYQKAQQTIIDNKIKARQERERAAAERKALRNAPKTKTTTKTTTTKSIPSSERNDNKESANRQNEILTEKNENITYFYTIVKNGRRKNYAKLNTLTNRVQYLSSAVPIYVKEYIKSFKTGGVKAAAKSTKAVEEKKEEYLIKDIPTLQTYIAQYIDKIFKTDEYKNKNIDIKLKKKGKESIVELHSIEEPELVKIYIIKSNTDRWGMIIPEHYLIGIEINGRDSYAHISTFNVYLKKMKTDEKNYIGSKDLKEELERWLKENITKLYADEDETKSSPAKSTKAVEEKKEIEETMQSVNDIVQKLFNDKGYKTEWNLINFRNPLIATIKDKYNRNEIAKIKIEVGNMNDIAIKTMRNDFSVYIETRDTNETFYGRKSDLKDKDWLSEFKEAINDFIKDNIDKYQFLSPAKSTKAVEEKKETTSKAKETNYDIKDIISNIEYQLDQTGYDYTTPFSASKNVTSTQAEFKINSYLTNEHFANLSLVVYDKSFKIIIRLKDKNPNSKIGDGGVKSYLVPMAEYEDSTQFEKPFKELKIELDKLSVARRKQLDIDLDEEEREDAEFQMEYGIKEDEEDEKREKRKMGLPTQEEINDFVDSLNTAIQKEYFYNIIPALNLKDKVLVFATQTDYKYKYPYNTIFYNDKEIGSGNIFISIEEINNIMNPFYVNLDFKFIDGSRYSGEKYIVSKDVLDKFKKLNRFDKKFEYIQSTFDKELRNTLSRFLREIEKKEIEQEPKYTKVKATDFARKMGIEVNEMKPMNEPETTEIIKETPPIMIDEDEAAKFDKGLDELTKLLQQAMQG